MFVDAAVESLKCDGFAGASARAIAERSGMNQGLIFYHFGSVANLLLAALDSVSADRMATYSLVVEAASTPSELVDVALRIFSADLDAGYVTVLVEMIAGSTSTPGLGVEVAARIGPWFAFAQGAIERTFAKSPFASVLPPADAAYGVVAMYLGLEMLTHLNGDRAPATALFGHVQQIAGLFNLLAPPPPTKEAP